MRNKCNILLWLIFMLFTQLVSAQNYAPFKDDDATLSVWQKRLTSQSVKDSLAVDGVHKKEIRKHYRARFEDINDMFKNKEAISEKEVHDYLTVVSNEIINNNVVLTSLQPRIYFARSADVNAYSCGEGTMFFNMGLFQRLHNESELAFIICHELAHYYLDHSNKRIIGQVDLFNDKEFKKEVKKIQKSEYAQNKKFGQLVTSLMFNNSRFSRVQESAADSVGFMFFANTRFDLKSACSTMDVLDSSEIETFNMELLLKKWISFPQFPFKENWLKKESAFFGGPVSTLTAAQKDSLKSHPDCALRKKKLQFFVDQYAKQGKTFVVNQQQFDLLIKRAKYDLIESFFKDEYISACMYFGFQLLEENPTDPWLIGTMAECFNQLYIHQKDHTLGKVAALPNPSGLKEYNVLLEFIQRARLEDFASIAHHFLDKNKGLATNERLDKAFENNKTIYK